MAAVFLKILNMSITASWLVLAVIALRFLLKKAPKAFSVVLWSLVGIRLILPFSFESVLSLIPSAETVPENIVYSTVPEINSGISVLNAAVNPIISETLAPNAVSGTNPMEIITRITSAVWVAGIAAMLLYTLVSFLLFRKKVREAAPLRDNIYLCDGIGTPFILGVFLPRIYLPSDIGERDAEHVIAHERAHIKRRDHLWKPLGFLLLTMYWFNPVLWVAYILLCRDIELACDEKVIKDRGIEIKKSYSEALVNCSVPRKMITACPLAFGEGSVKGRIKSVLHYKKPAFWIIIVSVIACVAVAVCFLTNPINNKTELPDSFTIIESYSDIEGLSLSVKEIELDTADAHISIEWKNKSGVDIWYGDPYDILYLENGEYASCAKTDLAFNLPAYNLDSGRSTTVNYDLTLFDLTKEGCYRFIVDASKDVPGDKDNKDLWIDFEIDSEALELESLSVKYPQFFDLDTKNGLEVYVWQMAENSYYCGLMSAKENVYSADLLKMSHSGATIDEMKTILSSYDISKSDIEVIPYQNPLSSYIAAPYLDSNPAIVDAYMYNLYEMLGLNTFAKEVETLNIQTDINHNGVKETLELEKIYQGTNEQNKYVESFILNFKEEDKVFYSEEAIVSHTGWNALFLYNKDGEDYLLRYNPNMGTGIAEYSYQLFYLAEDASEVVVQEDEVYFDLNASHFREDFDPQAIDAFLAKVNALLPDSIGLINTDDELNDIFKRAQKYHIPQFLFTSDYLGFSYDFKKSVLENLEEYKKKMEAYLDEYDN